MKKQYYFLKLNLGYIFVLLIFAGCSTTFLKVENEEKLKKYDEFENFVQISPPVTTETAPVENQETPSTQQPVSTSKTNNAKTNNAKTKTATSKKAAVLHEKKKSRAQIVVTHDLESSSFKRQPEFEDDTGFSGRRPLVDPFRVGEEVVHDVRYFKVHAGTIKFKVEPFVQVNQRKAYAFAYEIETSSLFSNFYSVQD
ncbi:MAG: hypothetical protein ACK5WZ_08250, partial [Pseudobdellovibrionaceae bacterium]